MGIFLIELSARNQLTEAQHGLTPALIWDFHEIKQQDKHWACADPQRNSNLYTTWTRFDKYDSRNPKDKTNIMFSKSTDYGGTWSDALKINQTSGDCMDSSNTVEGAVPCTGPNGEIFVSWSGPDGIVFDVQLTKEQLGLMKILKLLNMLAAGLMRYPAFTAATECL